LSHFESVIHPTAIVHPKARLDSSVRVGPYAIIDEDVQLGPGCIVGPHVYLTGKTDVGRDNRFFAGGVIGEAPQDLKYKGEPTGLTIGKGNTFREHVTINRSCDPELKTTIGSNNLFMASCHVGHDCRIANSVIVANGAALGGYVIAEDRAFISANCLVHQFCRVGTMAIMRGGSAVSLDLPPYTVVHRVNELCGLNIVGMRRAGLGPEDRLEIKRLYRALFRSRKLLRQAAAQASQGTWRPASLVLLEFVQTTKRGVCSDTSHRNGSQKEPEEE
jgi:UDP-N-acetylglucosamine acyltransferase